MESGSDSYGGGVAEDVYNRAGSVAGGGLSRDVPREAIPLGYRRPLRDSRLIGYDRAAARAKEPVPWEASKADRLTAEEAGSRMKDLYRAYQLVGAQPEILEAFHCAIYFSHTLNSASVIQPGRADVKVAGNSMPWKFVVDVLGNDLRRFFRAYADEVRENNRRVLNGAKNTDDIVAQEKAAWLREVADERGLSRYPDLAHDTSDACWNLNDSERSALTASKNVVFSAGANQADRIKFRSGQSNSSEAGNMFEVPTARPNALAAR